MMRQVRRLRILPRIGACRARMKALLREKEYQTDFVWNAVEKELRRREAAKPRKSKAKS